MCVLIFESSIAVCVVPFGTLRVRSEAKLRHEFIVPYTEGHATSIQFEANKEKPSTQRASNQAAFWSIRSGISAPSRVSEAIAAASSRMVSKSLPPSI